MAGKEIKESLVKKDGKFIVTMWHGHFFYLSYYLSREPHRWTTLTSSSVDGEIIAKIAHWFRSDVVRGSSYKDSVRALLKLKSGVKDGASALMIADGSRGPAYKAQLGSVILSKLTGVSVLPVSISFSRYWTVNSWDKFIIPKPFAKTFVIYGEPILVPKKADEVVLEEKREGLENELNRLTKVAGSHFLSDMAEDRTSQ